MTFTIPGAVTNLSNVVTALSELVKTHPVRLAPQEWMSGELMRTILAIGTKAAVAELRGGGKVR